MPRMRAGGNPQIDPRLAALLDSVAFFPSVISIYTADVWTTETPSGDLMETPELELAEAVPLYQDINVQIAPIQRPGVGEQRREIGVLEESSHLILVPDVLEDVTPHMVASTAAGEVYDLLTRDLDFIGRFTRMEARMIVPAAIRGQ